MNEILNRDEWEKLAEGICPDCGAEMILFGPRGGDSRNVLCGGCKTEFNRSSVLSSRIYKPCDPMRMREIYGITDANRPIGSFGLKKPVSQADLDGMLGQGCGNPHCTEDHKPLTSLFLKARCHHNANLSVRYIKGGRLEIRCGDCNRPVVNIAVAP